MTDASPISLVRGGAANTADPISERADLAQLVARAADGDSAAWDEIVRSLGPLVRGVARGFRLSQADADDVVQTTWLRLVEHIGRVRQPAALAGWLATTARRESLRVLQGQVREAVTAEVEVHDAAPSPEAMVLTAERNATAGLAVAELGPRRAELVRLLTQESTCYADIARRLDMPVGSIGPTWGRCAARLRRHREIVRLHHEA